MRDGHCIEFVKKKAIQQIENRDAAKEPPQKVIKIYTILADFKESGMTSKENKRKIKQPIVISQYFTCCLTIEDDPVIGFQKKDLIRLDLRHNDALVIDIEIAQALIEWLHVDEGSTSNILHISVV